jgi:purine-nucleoside phosphorylase
MDTTSQADAVAAAANHVRKQIPEPPTVGVILGSGLGGFAAGLANPISLRYRDIPYFVPSTVEGHRGDLVIGRLGGHAVAVLNGRLHFYEGYSLQQVTFPVRVLKELGCSVLVVTNAAGGLNPTFHVGDLMLITDHINIPGLAGNNPLFGPNDPMLGTRFPDLHNAYDRDLRDLAALTAHDLGLFLRRGVYVMLGGPSFETPAEVHFLQAMGGDAVGMSTAAEVVVARHAGLRVLGISMISNVLSSAPEAPAVNHQEVLDAGALAVQRLIPLIGAVIARL